MPFGVIARTGPGMRQAVRFGDRSTRRGTSVANLGRAIVTNGDSTAYVCDSASTVGAAVWGGASIAVLDGVHVVQGEGEGLGFLFPIFTTENATGSPTVKSFRFVCENLTTFPFGKRFVGKPDSFAFWQYIHFPDQRWSL